MLVNRRTFLAGLGAMALPLSLRAAPPVQFGYTAMTWGNETRQAIDDIAELGFAGIQFRADVVDSFKPDELKPLLAQKKLVFTALSSGQVSLDAKPEDEIATHVANARYVKECGGLYLQLLDKLEGHPRQATPEQCRRLGKLLTEIGKQTADLGIPLGYHNHLNTLSESPDALDAIMAASDPRYVKLELDTAHAVAGGGDPAKMIEAYKDRLLFLHLKDVVDLPEIGKGKYPFQFVELGRGRVDIPSVFAALERTGFKGWVVIELDRVPDKSGNPKASAQISKAYLQQKIGAAFPR